MIPSINHAENIEALDFPVIFSEKALEIARQSLVDNAGEDGEILRISVQGGGCAGMQYALNFVPSTEKYDLLSDMHGLKVVMDIFSVAHLKNTQIDYEESLQGAGFKFNNPNAKRSCGCGSSFN